MVAAAPVLQLKLALQADPRFTMPVAEFRALCRTHGAAGDDGAADALLTNLHDAGVVFSWPDGAHAGTVFLKPIEVADATFAALGLPGPTRHSAEMVAIVDRPRRWWRRWTDCLRKLALRVNWKSTTVSITASPFRNAGAMTSLLRNVIGSALYRSIAVV